MIIYEDGVSVVDVDLDVIPIVFTFSIHGVIYHYGIGGVTDEKCPYDVDIKKWMKKVRPEINNLIWAHKQPNMNPAAIPRIDTPLKLRLRLKL